MLNPELLAAYNRGRSTPHTNVFCHAPFANMNFAQNGNVTVCCYNRTYVLGTYPTDALDRIWWGAPARRLRESMMRNALPGGCDICLSQFTSANFSGLRARSFDDLAEQYECVDGVPFAFPKLMEFEISNSCNLECTMCTGFFSSSIRHNRERLPPLVNPYDEAFVRQLEAFVPHLRAARFLGGEPFLVRTYYQIWDLLIRLNPDVEISITTNATILNDRVKSILERLRAHIIVSIDSLQSDVYESIRVNARLADVLRNLEYFQWYAAARGTTLSLAVCPMRQNWRELPAIVDYCNARNLQVYFNTVVYPGDAAFQYMPHRELQDVCEFLEASTPSATGSRLHRDNRAKYQDMVRQVIAYRNQAAEWREGQRQPFAADDWTLVRADGQVATLEQPAESPQAIRLTIAPFDVRPGGCARLLSRRMNLQRGEQYVVAFQARASGAHRLTVRAERAADGDDSLLDLWLEFGLSSSWEHFEVGFVPKRDEAEARLCIEMGTDPGVIEVSDVTMRIAARSS
jgi:MoaA/NifB/PqqE/SkfB family radical SAM enzyme